MRTMTAIGGSLPLNVVNALDMGKRSRAAAIALLIYDHLISLELEIDLIWRERKTRPAFLLYTFNRFFALTYLIFDSIPLTKSGVVSSRVYVVRCCLSARLHKICSCVIYLMCDDLVMLITTLTVQAVLQLRVYALYDRSLKILIFMLVLCAIEVIIMVVLVAITISHLEGLPIASTSTGCFYNGVLSLSALFWVPGLIFEPILFFLVAFKAWPRKQQGPTPLANRIARDSLFYFVVVFIELLASTIIWAHAPTYINMVMPWSAAAPSILGSRLMLNMREIVRKQGGDSYILESYGQAQTLRFHNQELSDTVAGDTVTEESS